MKSGFRYNAYLGGNSGKMLKMKTLQQGTVTVPFIRSLLLGVVASPMLIQPLMADEFINVTDIKECGAIPDKAERLLCYDTTADGGVFNQQQLEQVQKEEFGSKEKEHDSSVDQIAVTIVRIQRSSTGIHYFYTADDAVWKQSSSRGGKWSLGVPLQVEIKAGVMSSFFLVTEGGKSTRVERVR